AVTLPAQLDSASVLIMLGVMQIMTGLVYRMPMPVQPLKAMAAIVISSKLASGVLYGGGLAVGILMLILAVTGLRTWLAPAVPGAVVGALPCGRGVELTL